MWNKGPDAYMESRILSADPMELVNVLYQACCQAVIDARSHLVRNEIAERSRSINKACEILLELTASLDAKRGGEIAQRLGQLYDYMLSRLLEANMQQSDPPLAEVLSLLTTLAEGWSATRNAATTETSASNRVESAWPEEKLQEAHVSQGWSL